MSEQDFYRVVVSGMGWICGGVWVFAFACMRIADRISRLGDLAEGKQTGSPEDDTV